MLVRDTKKTNTNLLLNIPSELLYEVIEFVASGQDLKSVLKLSQVNKALHTLVDLKLAQQENNELITQEINCHRFFAFIQARGDCALLRSVQTQINNQNALIRYNDRRNSQARLRTISPFLNSGKTARNTAFTSSFLATCEPIVQMIFEKIVLKHDDGSFTIPAQTYADFLKRVVELSNFGGQSSQIWNVSIGCILALSFHMAAAMGINLVLKGLHELRLYIKDNMQLTKEERNIKNEEMHLLNDLQNVFNFFKWLQKYRKEDTDKLDPVELATLTELKTLLNINDEVAIDIDHEANDEVNENSSKDGDEDEAYFSSEEGSLSAPGEDEDLSADEEFVDEEEERPLMRRYRN